MQKLVQLRFVHELVEQLDSSSVSKCPNTEQVQDHVMYTSAGALGTEILFTPSSWKLSYRANNYCFSLIHAVHIHFWTKYFRNHSLEFCKCNPPQSK